MARNIAPQCKQCRRIGEKLFLKGDRCASSKCSMIKRNFVPGMHISKGKPRLSGYGLQLKEKQKAKKIYGVLEKQFRNYYSTATKKTGNTAEIMMKLLENRLDNVVYRAGLASSRKIARQLVNHGHFTVDNQKCDIASKQVKISEIIAVKKNKQKNKYWENLKKEIDKKDVCSWLEINKGDLSIKVKENPNVDQVKQNIAMNLIIEFYSR